MLGWVILGARERIDVRAWGLGSASPCWWLNRLRLAQLALSGRLLLGRADA